MEKYRVTISCQTYYTIDVEANTEENAEKIVQDKLEKDYCDTFKNSLEAYDDYWYVVEGESFVVPSNKEE